MADTQAASQHDSLESINTGPARPVAIENIEARLNELWREVASTAQNRGGSGAVTMAQVLNLVVHAESQDLAGEYMRETELITGRHPCRVITLVQAHDDPDMPVQGLVSMFCQIPPAGGRQVCCEQVTIASGSNSLRQLPAAVLPLLLSDLPVFLWWPHGAPFDDYVFRQLADSLNRLIVDSATFDNPEGTLSRISSVLKSNWPRLASTDMNWGRLTTWRELIASFFDGPALRPYLERLSRVTIEYALPGRGKAVNRGQALMLAGWLASRLGWQPTDNVYRLVHADDQLPPIVHISLKAGKRPIDIYLRPIVRQSDVPGSLSKVRLVVAAPGPAGQQGEVHASFEVALCDEPSDPGDAWTEVQVEGIAPTKRNIHLDTLSRADLLDIELEVYSRDRVYEETMNMVAMFIKGVSAGRDTDGPRRLISGEAISSAQPQNPQRRPPGSPGSPGNTPRGNMP
ncbi:MAG TPA: glucose-6-phosphate dehydrogenase assembly protein OpcA [Chloroflexia bacterium]|jgi:glucose-6-phosphate dehydrogenase assembly protein OpcA